MRDALPRTALLLQTAYPVLMVIYAAYTFPAAHADAQRFMGPPYYLPFEVFFVIVLATQLITALLLWKKHMAGWLCSFFINGGLALFFACFAISDRMGNAPMPGWVYVLLVGIAAFFGVIPVLLISRQSLKFFRLISPPPIESV